MMQGAAGRGLTSPALRLQPHHPVFLQDTSGGGAQRLVAEVGYQVILKLGLMVLHVAGIALAAGDRLVLQKKLLGGICEGFFLLQAPRAAFALEFKIPVFRKFLGLGQAVGFGADSPLLSFKVGGALPDGTVGRRYTRTLSPSTLWDAITLKTV
ncbi:hypothetical protein [Neorhizobium galegae]|uniref:hypothetical protein n=1 Tax=Neorhizobium galegae TaxID=399 RepID=UPI000621F25C|nr:hypothetical protein [Neorhizobium galegae]CDZ27451.1 Hypothetical protein NGAL_HAMBI490_22970 [Neorhizobium galegae bv. officinalis]MCM2497464.1 hypothetical protein [Neorhizobium galegae]MCQ1771554.1 hypothetical protein [Neorhizobium galegae]MCQ1778572.1 hypothetical protein [Neorhizobium galegae]MCQ1795063.1 hypothetical protein [Neorhizobium galegae]